ncbi:MAG: PAS sensor protein [Actinobacteria bacterium]|nr:PAS sensor protein [Actinomycetota bacterium]
MRIGIKQKVVLLTIVIIVFALGASIIVGMFAFTREFSDALRSKALTTGKVLKYQMEKLMSFGLLPEEIVGFEEQCAEVVANYGDISYAMVADTRGRILFHNQETRNGTVLADPEILVALADPVELTRLNTEGKDRFFEVVVPVFTPRGEHLASIVIGAPEQVVLIKTRRILMQAAAVAFFCTGISIVLLLYALSAWVSKPIDSFLAVIGDIARSDKKFTKKVTVGSTDEIGLLGSAFNEMIDALEETTVSKNLLLESEEKYRSLVEHSQVGVFILQDRIIRFANKRLCEIFAYECNEVIERLDPRSLIHPEEQDEVESDLLRCFAGEIASIERDAKCVRKSGEIFPASILGALSQYHGRPAIVGTILDKGKEKMLEEQLLQSQKLEAVGKLAGGIAHDFNNLLTAILGYTELLLVRLPESSPLRGDVGEIRNAGTRAAGLTRQLLAFSRKQVFQPKVINMNDVVASMDVMLNRLLGEDIERKSVFSDGLWNVRADPGQMEQVILNLAVNARDAMTGGGKITVETANVVLDDSYAKAHTAVIPGPYVMTALSDTGVGMDEKTQARIFEPFFTTKGVGKGTGLGLSTVYGIVKQSHGVVWVYSEPGKGTTFKVYLPAVMESAETIPPPEDIDAAAYNGSETILLTEDEDIVRDLVVEVLRVGGYKVLHAFDGEEALRIAEGYKGTIHLLVTDVVMPKMSGRELVGRIMPARPQMKVLYMSGYTENAIVHHGVLDEGTECPSRSPIWCGKFGRSWGRPR